MSNKIQTLREKSLNIFAFSPLMLLLFLPLLVSTFSSCNRHGGDDGDKLVFSTDTLMFDTVFTTIGSITRNFTVYNPSHDPIKLDIFLAGNTQSYYSINVNGKAGYEFHDIEIPAHDSIFVFVKVNINPTNQNTPYLVTDSVLFCRESRRQAVQLVAFGQDAHFIIPDHNNGSMAYKVVAHEHENTHWTNDKPWVIYGWAVVDSLGSLTIDPGTRIYFHKGGGLWVFRYGHLNVNGTVDEPVLFRGDRLESFYDSDYAQWDRIWISEGNADNVINNAIITNAEIGLEVSTLMEYLGNKTIVNNTVIQNNNSYGVLGWAANLEMNNCQISNNGSHSLVMQVGNYKLNHVTVGNYYSGTPVRRSPAVVIGNYYETNELNAAGEVQAVRVIGDTKLECNNCIFYGNADNEFAVSKTNEVSLDYILRNCIVKRDSLNEHYVNCINVDPKFVSNYGQDYNLKAESPAIDAGIGNLGITADLLGRLRNGIPDIGAFEYYPAETRRRL